MVFTAPEFGVNKEPQLCNPFNELYVQLTSGFLFYKKNGKCTFQQLILMEIICWQCFALKYE